MIKKIFAAVLIFCMLFSLSGCTAAEKKAKPLRICIDMTFTGSWGYTPSRFAKELEAYLEDEKRTVGHVEDVEIEVIPEQSEERAETIERIYAEMENGGGPDLFLVSNATQDTIGENALFPFPEKGMETGTFLTLDSYIENAQYTDWDKLYSVILEAGQTEEGQQIVPLSYTLPVTCFRASEVEHTPSAERTWSDMVSDKTGALQASALWLRTEPCFYPQWEGDYLEYILGETVDFEKGELLFSEWELLSVVQDLVMLSQVEMTGAFETVPAHYQVCMNVGYRERWIDDDELYAGIGYSEPLSMVPLYSVDGGATAAVISYAAVNANSKQPETAFEVLDFLLSRPMQQKSPLYKCFLGGVGMPMHTELVVNDMRVYTEMGTWGMPWEISDAYCSAMEAITGVHFRNTLEEQLDDLFRKCYVEGQVNNIGESNNMQNIVFEAYSEMQKTVQQAKTE